MRVFPADDLHQVAACDVLSGCGTASFGLMVLGVNEVHDDLHCYNCT